MKAWQLQTEPNTGIKLVDIPDPTPGAGEVVVDVRAAGLCHSDVGFLDGTLNSVLAFTPIVLGHEAAGVISEIGEGVTGFEVGDRVAIHSMGKGNHDGTEIGTGRNGAYAEKTIGRDYELVKLPDNVDFAQAAAATDAGMTSYNAVLGAGGVKKGTRVGIVGLGGLGLTAARIAVLTGAEVYAAEINADVHQAGRDAGVKEIVSEAAELAPFKLDVIIDFAGFGTTTAGALHAVNPGGRVVQIGLGVAEALIPTQLMTFEQLTLVGSLGGKPSDTQAVVDLLASGELSIATETVGFEDINDGLARLEAGDVKGKRLVAVLGE